MKVHEILHEFRSKMIAATGVNNPIIAITLNREAQGRLDWELLEISRYVRDGQADKSRVTIFEGIELDPKPKSAARRMGNERL